MRIGAIFVACLALAGTAHAAPITLICNGSLTAGDKQIPINGETAIVDLEARTFKPPMYAAFALIRLGESDLTFGSELPNLSTWGSLDRVSGSLAMNVMRPDQRQKLQGGGTANFLAWMSGKCVPAQRMF
jgi:hypothetical protein